MAYMHPKNNIVTLPPGRRVFLLLLLLLGFGVLAFRGLYLQCIHDDFLRGKADAVSKRNLQLFAQRGKIVDRNGELLAISGPVQSVYIDPRIVEMSERQKANLAKLLKMKASVITKRMARKKSFVYLKRRLSPKLARDVMALNITGLNLQKEYRRFYPAGDVASHVVGFADIDNKGREGLELFRNEVLSGQVGHRRVIRDTRGRVVEDIEAISLPKDGQDLVLSIDRRIQYLAFRELARAVAAHKAKAASAIVLDAKTGEVLAMVNLPTYNPNNPVNIRGKTRNRTVTDIFEPGSTMKPVTAAAAMQFGSYKPYTKIQTAPGRMSIGPATINDVHSHGMLSVAQVVQKSSNVGAAKMALSLKKEELWSAFNQLGFGVKTNVGYPGEVAGKVRPYKTWRPIEQATMSYGHGISVTLLQLARSYTVFANQGELMPVSLQKLEERPIGRPVFSEKIANSVKDMLELVVQPGGTALKAQVPGYRVAGKTGTAHKLGPKGYEKDKYVSSFVGMAPASNPRLIMAVMVDEPTSGQYYGGTVAAPVFSDVMSDSLRLLGVPQDAPNNNVVISPTATDDAKEVI